MRFFVTRKVTHIVFCWAELNTKSCGILHYRHCIPRQPFNHANQLISITLATSPRHSDHKPTSNKSPALTTAEKLVYKKIGKEFDSHESVNHSAGEYARGDVTTNTVESSFAILKRGLYGTFHNVSEQHLQRYANEFDFRWNPQKNNLRKLPSKAALTKKGSTKMATLPTLQEAERAILDVFKQRGTRSGESIKSIVLTDLMSGNPAPFRVDDLNAAIKSMHGKNWIDASSRDGFITLLDLGFAEV